jgi:2-polyprenyl-3-methyl-5-hydroxy-6-metoxy-1,4-benzoquinol methylase
VPCGMGWGTSQLKGCRSLLGIDISPEAIEEARTRYGGVADFRVGDMGHLELPSSTIDVVSCLEGIEHVPPAVGASFVRECGRVLRPGGLLILSSPHCNDKPHSGNPYHMKEYQPHEIRRLVKPLFEVVDETHRLVENLTVTMFLLRRSTVRISTTPQR